MATSGSTEPVIFIPVNLLNAFTKAELTIGHIRKQPNQTQTQPMVYHRLTQANFAPNIS